MSREPGEENVPDNDDDDDDVYYNIIITLHVIYDEEHTRRISGFELE